jgi:hypothetical protein
LFPFKGHFFKSEAIKIVHVQSGVDCILQCMLQDKSCRSVNFRKMSVNDGAGNCQLLYGADSENPELLHEDEHFDYYVLLQPNRVSINRANAVITMTCMHILEIMNCYMDSIQKMQSFYTKMNTFIHFYILLQSRCHAGFHYFNNYTPYSI